MEKFLVFSQHLLMWDIHRDNTHFKIQLKQLTHYINIFYLMIH